MFPVFFYTDHSVASTGYQFNADAACSGKQIKGSDNTLNRFSLAKSVVGRALNVRGTSNLLLLYIPLITRMLIGLVCQY